MKKHRHIDIYFILYLTALVLLLAGGNPRPQGPTAEPEPEFPFRIKVEKPVLVCKIITDSTGQPALIADTVNYISDFGKVYDVQYSFAVEDEQNAQRTSLSSQNTTPSTFSFSYDSTNRTVVFRWRPAVGMDFIAERTYNIHVTASATSANNSQHRMQAQTQFAVVIVDERPKEYIAGNYPTTPLSQNEISNHEPSPVPPNTQEGHGYEGNNTDQGGRGQKDIGEFLPNANFSIKPQATTIRAVAGTEWETTILCYGFSPAKHLSRPPEVSIQNSPTNAGGSVSVAGISENAIILKGKMPDVGRSSISVALRRAGYLAERQVSFTLLPLSIRPAEVPAVMHPDVEYSINSGVPADLAGATSYIKENAQTRLRHAGSGTIKFKPTADDIGKTLIFERWLGNDLLGQKYHIKVEDFPPPEITSIESDGTNRIILKTITYGLHGGRLNNIKELRIAGNAKYIAIYGKTHQNRAQMQVLEQFLLEPIDSKKAFEFEVRAVDRRGRVSEAIKK